MTRERTADVGAMYDAPPRFDVPADAGGPARTRPRRLRRTEPLRRLVREHALRPGALIHPIFVTDGTGVEHPIESMPGHSRLSVDRLDRELEDIATLGVGGVLLFGVPAVKDAIGGVAWREDGPVPRAIERIRTAAPDLVVIADVCLCEYTDHGHCGILDEGRRVDNDATLPLLARAAVTYAGAGADLVAPSAMMDGQVRALRLALDDAGYAETAIMAYSAKYASAFYGPFRDAAGSAPAFGDRRAYQMDPPNAREALREAALDAAEGADIIMVKPAGPYLDVIARVRERLDLPLAAYQVSGEYAMLKAAAALGWLDERRGALESLVAIRRAGADLLITYFAKQAAGWLRDQR